MEVRNMDKQYSTSHSTFPLAISASIVVVWWRNDPLRVGIALSHSYYQRIMALCLALMFVLLITHVGMSFAMLRSQTINHSSVLSEKILSELKGQTQAYFDNLDEMLDSIYQYPSFLAGLDSDVRDRSEYPTRSLLSQTAYFRPLRCIRIYNRNHILRGCYNRSSAEMYRQESIDIYADPTNPFSECVQDFINGETARFRVFCCDYGGDTFLRVVKRVYQDMGRREVGYIVCDMQAMALEGYALSALTSENQYAWLYTNNGGVCDLTNTSNGNAISFMKRTELFEAAFSDMVDGNYFCCTQRGPMGETICLFTDEIEMRRSMSRLMRMLLRETGIMILLYAAAMVILSRTVRRRIRGVMDVLRRIERGETRLRLPSQGRDEIAAICGGFNSMMDHMEITTAEEARLRRAFEESRYQSLQAQVNPHFLFNTLENISAIALSQNCDVVDEMCGALSAMLRYSIEDDRLDRTVSLREELEYVHQYMLIIDVRMNHAISMAIEVPEELKQVRLPRLSVQPLVDNAIRHGLRRKRGDKWFKISARPVKNGVEIMVEDNGIGSDIEEMNRIIRHELNREMEHTSIGIRNIHERVQLLFGEPYGLRANRRDDITQMILFLPNEEGSAL